MNIVHFIASLVISVLLTLYLIFSNYIVGLASSISWWFGLIVFVLAMAVAIDFLTQVGNKK